MFRSLLAVVVVMVAGLATVITQQSPASAAPTLPAGFTWTGQPTGFPAEQQLSDFAILPGGGMLAAAKSGIIRYVAPNGSNASCSRSPT